MRDTGIAFEIESPLSFEQAVARCREELAAAGFGVLTEIDIQAKLREKLGVEVEPNLILGAVAVLLPCNVAIAVERGRTVVRAMNPEGAMRMFDDSELRAVASEVSGRLRGVVERLEG